ncbi:MULTISPECIES: CS1 type fimbrial major subunit [Pseudomonas]|uniref:CS1 type fimbrial major subunit n=2 Tax=unclassified Pseudomonas TaxID=196821 RepID=A0AB39I408_9PSED|nr:MULTISPECIES: CS1 type fimbrial major subunit [Pseudomonas]KJK09830.1 adhesin [Pseudomonas sp. 5]MDD1976875.1 fimbrial protein [Pseudomonas putida]MDH2557753.1 CS1 type fimbrial major subunit [Pseudomonas sp. Hg5Tf]QYX47649.1 fimbrial protein [Pseudomonas sp. S11A 273]
MKRMLLALPLALLSVGSAYAVDPIEKQVQITAQVPTDAFYVEPVGGNWMNDPQEMAWNSFRSELQPIRKQLQVKSTIGPISAYLLSPAVVASGSDSIGLDVKVADTVLTTTTAEVVSAAQAAPGAVIGFEVAAQAAGAGGYEPGNYQGLVSMMFETAAP